MTNEEALRMAYSKRKDSAGEERDFLNTIIQALKQEPCEDAISRQAAIGIIQNWLNFDTGYSWGEKNVMKCAISELRDLPPVSTEKTGRWIDTGSGQECSECGEIQYGYDSFRKYCANCGSYNGGSNNGNE